jgi:hypothetical protein
VGSGDDAKAQEVFERAKAKAKGQPGVVGWMIQSTEEQLKKLSGLLANSPFNRISSNASA